MTLKDESGQALLEGVIALLLLGTVSTVAAGLGRSQWARFRCSVRAFERTRAAMERSGPAPGGDGWFRGVERCGRIRETVALRLIENGEAPWSRLD